MQPEKNNLNIFLKITFLAIILIVLNLFLGQKNTDFNQNSITANAQEEQAGGDEFTTTCTDKINVKTTIGPLEVDVGGPNELEMPIGEATDDAEKMAEDIMKELEVIISASQSEIDSATNIVSLAKACDEGNCQGNCEQQGGTCSCEESSCAIRCDEPPSTCTMGCPPPPGPSNCCYNAGIGCEPQDCTTSCLTCSTSGPSGGVCPITNMEGIATEQQNIENQVNRISTSVGIIEEKFTAKNHPPIGVWKLLLDLNLNLPIIGQVSLYTPLCVCDPLANTGVCLSPLPLNFGSCTTEEDMILDKLYKARTGNYPIGLGSALNLVENPPGLIGCVSDYAREMGEEGDLPEGQPIQELFSCPQAIEAGYLNENPECLSNKEKCLCYGSSEGTPERADNYVCCTTR